MDEFEQKVKHLRRAMPSADLDRRIDDALAIARRRQKSPRRTVWWWTVSLAAAGSLAALLVVATRRPVPPASEVVVYRIEAQGRLLDMLVNSTMTRDSTPQFFSPANTP